MNAYDYLKSLIEDGYFDDPDKDRPSGLRRLVAASDALLHAESSVETILPAQQAELVQHWHARRVKEDVDTLV